jgi:hypothetical protein
MRGPAARFERSADNFFRRKFLRLIDEYLPDYDAREIHRNWVRAPDSRIFSVIRTTDLVDAMPVRICLALRALPGVLLSPVRGLRRFRIRLGTPMTLRDFEAQGFRVLAENPPHELLIGLMGSFWKPDGGLLPVNVATFKGSQLPGTARVAWNFSIAEQENGMCELATETRVKCADAKSRRYFGLYWAVVRPGSGLIRRCMLRSIRKKAEGAT